MREYESFEEHQRAIARRNLLVPGHALYRGIRTLSSSNSGFDTAEEDLGLAAKGFDLIIFGTVQLAASASVIAAGVYTVSRLANL